MKTIIAAVCVVLLAGCASYAGRGLAAGQSSAEEVEALVGPSVERRSAPNGESVRYYSRLPFGRQTYAARFDRNGRLIAVEQRLGRGLSSQVGMESVQQAHEIGA